MKVETVSVGKNARCFFFIIWPFCGSWRLDAVPRSEVAGFPQITTISGSRGGRDNPGGEASLSCAAQNAVFTYMCVDREIQAI